ncbi:MAG: MFS transporter [Opitutae bacterium]|nr:MFS transporter [Opitutae bacterium]
MSQSKNLGDHNAASAQAPTPESRGDTKGARFPKSVFFIVGNEACERFSFYGMRSILTLYIVYKLYGDLAGSGPEGLEAANDRAVRIVHLFTMGVYFMPLLGAWIADKFWGKFRTIVVMSLFYCLGNGVLAFTVGNEWGLVAGLAMIAIGSGGIKPCVSAFMGDQFSEAQKQFLPKAFGMFYWAINFGSFFSFAIIPLVKEDLGYAWAFGIPGIFMGLATLLFVCGSGMYKHVPPERVARKLLAARQQCPATTNPAPTTNPIPATNPPEAPMTFGEKFRAIKGILLIFAIVPVFWALFDQMNSTWVVLSNQMAASEISLLSWAYPLNAETVQSANSICVMLFVPLFTFALYPLLNRTRLLRATPLRRMTVGMVLAACSFVICGVLQNAVSVGAAVSIWWMILPYAVLSSGEVLFSTTGLEFAFSQAPVSMRSTITSFWNFTIVIGNFIVVAVVSLGSGFSQTQRFFFYSALMFAVAAIFAIASRTYKYRD